MGNNILIMSCLELEPNSLNVADVIANKQLCLKKFNNSIENYNFELQLI